MLLTIDIGNTSTNFGVFEGEKLLATWRGKTGQSPISNIQYPISNIIICSVVPGVERKLIADIRKQLAVKPHFVTAENIPGIKVKVKKKKEVGADRVVDALAAYTLYGGPAIVVDFGTATTFDVVSAKGEYLGGAIAPGIDLARDALYNRTAKLPKVEIKAPRRVIGTDTISAMQSGLVFGYVSLVEGMIRKLKVESGKLNVGVVATGGYAPLICKYTKIIEIVDPHLTLKGLRLAGEALHA